MPPSRHLGALPNSAAPLPGRRLKLLLLGDASVGKTSLLHNWVDGGHFTRTMPKPKPTIGCDIRVKTVDTTKGRVRLEHVLRSLKVVSPFPLKDSHIVPL